MSLIYMGTDLFSEAIACVGSSCDIVLCDLNVWDQSIWSAVFVLFMWLCCDSWISERANDFKCSSCQFYFVEEHHIWLNVVSTGSLLDIDNVEMRILSFIHSCVFPKHFKELYNNESGRWRESKSQDLIYMAINNIVITGMNSLICGHF